MILTLSIISWCLLDPACICLSCGMVLRRLNVDLYYLLVSSVAYYLCYVKSLCFIVHISISLLSISPNLIGHKHSELWYVFSVTHALQWHWSCKVSVFGCTKANVSYGKFLAVEIFIYCRTEVLYYSLETWTAGRKSEIIILSVPSKHKPKWKLSH